MSKLLLGYLTVIYVHQRTTWITSSEWSLRSTYYSQHRAGQYTLFRRRRNSVFSFVTHMFNRVYSEHSAFLLLLHFFQFKSCSLFGLLYRSAVSLMQLHLLLFCFTRTRVTVLSALRLWENFAKYFATQGIFVWYPYLFLPVVFEPIAWYAACSLSVPLLLTNNMQHIAPQVCNFTIITD